MRYRTLGRTGLRVSEVGFGAWAIGGNAHGNSYGPTEDKVSLMAVRRAVDLGCNFFDTADVYGWGHSEELLGQALADDRDEVLIATKVGGDFYHGGVRSNFDPDYIPFALGLSLQRLKTDHVDLYQLHNPPEWMMGDPQTYEVLEALQAENRIRHFGVSVHSPEEGALCIEASRPATVQIPFSIFRQEWVADFLGQAKKAGIGVIAREPLGNGFLTGRIPPTAVFLPGDIRHRWPQEMIAARARVAQRLTFLHRDGRTVGQSSLKFVLSFPEVSVTIPGAKTPAHVEENAASSEAPDLTEEELGAIRDLYRRNFG